MNKKKVYIVLLIVILGIFPCNHFFWFLKDWWLFG